MRRSFPFLILVLTIVTVGPLGAQVRRIMTDDSPSYIWADQSRNHIHVFTAGVDRDFNGAFDPDSGDVAPRWFVIDGTSEMVIDSVTFGGFFNSFPIRPSVDPRGRRVFLPQLGRITMYDLDTRLLLKDTVVEANASAVSYDSIANRLVFTIRPGFTEAGVVGCIDGTTLLPLFSSRTGISPGMTAYRYGRADSTMEYYSICEGTGGPDATLSYNAYTPDVFGTVNDMPLGGGAIAMTTTPSLVVLAFNGAASIRLLNPQTHRELSFSPIASGSHKPLSVAIDSSGVVLVGTADGRLLFIDTTTRAIVDSMTLGGQVMALAVGRNSTVFAALGTGRDSTVVAIDVPGRVEVADTIVSGSPVALLADTSGRVHVFANSGDSTRWIRCDSFFTSQPDSRAIPGRLYVPAQVAYSPEQEQILFALNDRVLMLSNVDVSIDPVVFSDEHVSGGQLVGVTAAGDHYLVTELSSDSAANLPGYVHLLNTQGEFSGVFATGPRPVAAAGTKAEPQGAYSFYALDRGSRGGSRSLLSFYQYAPSIFAPDDTLGASANHIVIVDQAGVTMTGSHEVVSVDLDDWTTDQRYAMGTDGFNGPRETLVLNSDNAAVSTYNGDVRVLAPAGGYRIFETGGKAEGMGYLPALKKLFVAIPFAPDYSADSAVVVFDTDALLASIDRTSPLASRTTLSQNVPNPATDRTTISFSIDRPDRAILDLYTIEGRQIARLIEQDLESGTYSVTVKAGDLAPGVYIYTLRSNGGIESRTLTVVR